MPPALQSPFVLWFVLSAAVAGLAYAFLRRELRVRATLYASFLIALERETAAGAAGPIFAPGRSEYRPAES